MTNSFVLLLSSKAASCDASPKERSSQIQVFTENEDSVVEIIPLNRWLKTMSLLPTGLQHELNKNINIPIWGNTTCMCFPEDMCALQSATIANHAKTLFETEEVQLGCQYSRHRLCRVCRHWKLGKGGSKIIVFESALDGAIYYFVVKLTT